VSGFSADAVEWLHGLSVCVYIQAVEKAQLQTRWLFPTHLPAQVGSVPIADCYIPHSCAVIYILSRVVALNKFCIIVGRQCLLLTLFFYIMTRDLRLSLSNVQDTLGYMLMSVALECADSSASSQVNPMFFNSFQLTSCQFFQGLVLSSYYFATLGRGTVLSDDFFVCSRVTRKSFWRIFVKFWNYVSGGPE